MFAGLLYKVGPLPLSTESKNWLMSCVYLRCIVDRKKKKKGNVCKKQAGEQGTVTSVALGNGQLKEDDRLLYWADVGNNSLT